MPTSTPRRSKYLRCIPPANVLRERLDEMLNETAQLRELLATAEKIEAVEQAATNGKSAAKQTGAFRE